MAKRQKNMSFWGGGWDNSSTARGAGYGRYEKGTLSIQWIPGHTQRAVAGSLAGSEVVGRMEGGVWDWSPPQALNLNVHLFNGIQDRRRDGTTCFECL